MEAPANIELCEMTLEQYMSQKSSMIDAISNTISEGETLLSIIHEKLSSNDFTPESTSSQGNSSQGNSSQANSSQANSSQGNSSQGNESSHPQSETSNTRSNLLQSKTSIEGVIESLKQYGVEIEELNKKRKLRMEMCLQLRLFERDALSLCNQFEGIAEDIDSYTMNDERLLSKKKNKKLNIDVPTAEKQLQLHNELVSRVQQMAFDFVQRGQELISLFDSLSPAITIYADYNSGGSDSSSGKKQNNLSGSPSPSSSGSTAQQRIQAILEYLHERELYLEEMTEIRRVRLEESLQLSQLHSDANQVLRWMGNAESMLAASFLIPLSLQEAQDLQLEHEQFQLAIEVRLFSFSSCLYI